MTTSDRVSANNHTLASIDRTCGDRVKTGDRTPNNHTLASIDRTSSDRVKVGDRTLNIYTLVSIDRTPNIHTLAMKRSHLLMIGLKEAIALGGDKLKTSDRT